MKKILIGICGVGNGHKSRQTLIIEHLLKYDVKIVVAAFDKDIEYFRCKFNEIDVIGIRVPIYYINDLGIDFKNTLENYKISNFDYFKEYLEFSVKVQEVFEGNPDCVFSDYERNSALFAYATGIPLYCFEQQAKLLTLTIECLYGTQLKHENYLLNYYFPKVTKRYVSSFFPLKDCANCNIETIPPIIEYVEKKETIENKILVYFSPYSIIPRSFEEVLEIFKLFSEYDFYIYTDKYFGGFYKFKHMHFTKTSSKFKDDLMNCSCLVSTAGHQLISEAIDVEVPMYLLPFKTFEQNFNCHMVEKYKIGMRAERIDASEFTFFLKKRKEFVSYIKHFKIEYNWAKWNNILFSKLERDIGIVNKGE